MRLFGLSITRARPITDEKALIPSTGQLTSVSGSDRGWWPLIRESFAGAWQRNVEIEMSSVLTFAAVYACVTLIASDIGKLRLKLIQATDAKRRIWEETDNPAYSPVLRKPNRFQTRIKFYEQWMVSKLLHGNTYVLKQRNNAQKVEAMYILDATRVRPLVAPDGQVYYQLNTDNLSGLTEAVVVPASEIIHDVMVPLYHPLCGVSPLTACGLAAVQGLKIQENATKFFQNGSNPGGVLTAPGRINDETATRLKEYWQSEFTGENVGRVAVLGDGLKYEQMHVNATDAQLIEQLKWTAENVCTAFHVPPYMIGVGPMPTYNNIEALNMQYYVQALQNPIESIELLIDEGFALPLDVGVEFDLDQLLRMDTPTRVKSAQDFIASGAGAPNEARLKFFGLGPVKGGETPYMQQQNYSLAALAERDSDKPFAKPAPAPAVVAQPAPADEDEADMPDEKAISELLRKELEVMTA